MFGRYDHVELSCVPCGEDCIGVGHPEYDTKGREEQRRYLAMLERRFPVPEGVYGRLSIKGFPHDFGTYHEVVARFDTECERSVEWAYHCEANLPETWDDEAVLPVPEEKPSVLTEYMD